VEAITSGISMVSRMVSYSNNLERLFGELQQKADGINPGSLSLNTLSTNLNNDAHAINELSEEFNDALNQLDKRYGIK
jgi:ABC-type transporter Mla subunit MlaD